MRVRVRVTDWGAHVIRHRRRLGAALIAALGCLALTTCRRQPPLSGDAQRQAVVAFYTGLAALQTSQEVLAREQFERVIAVAPQEPAAWANVGLLLLRQQDLDGAAERLTKAAQLAPENADVQRLLGLLESRRGNLPAAIEHWKHALQGRPGDTKAAYALALDQERQGSPESVADAQRTLESLADRSRNLVVELEYARLAAKRGDATALARAIESLSPASESWPPDIKERFRTVQQTAASNPQGAGQSIAFLRNVLMRLPEYRRAYAEVSTPLAEVGEPLDRFLVVPNPQPRPAALDSALAFTLAPEKTLPPTPAAWIGIINIGPELRPGLAAVDGGSVRFTTGLAWSARGPARRQPTPVTPADVAVLAADLNYDFLIDLVVAGPHGLEVLRQQPDRAFVSVTAQSKLPAAVLSAATSGLWAADVDTDGDLDIVDALTDGAPQMLRNNGDGTFAVLQPFPGVTRVRGFAWADLDGDGVPDAALLDAAGSIRVYFNTRGGSFAERPLPQDTPKAVAINAAELTGDSTLDTLALTANGALLSLSWSDDQRAWTRREVARVPSTPDAAVGAARLFVTDLDNNGASDIIAAGPGSSRVVLRGAGETVHVVDAPIAIDVRAAADLDGDGRVELVGRQPDGQAAIARSSASRQYHWQAIRTHAATATGDQRINSFGIGGELEVRTGLHLQKQLIEGPVTHVGLGEATASEVVRITWPNGTLQSEFNVGADASIAATQRLKGSCPWLFAWNGSAMTFVTDVLWRSPLGLRINAQTTADVVMTEDWVRIRGDQLQPRDGAYDLRITAELWETHFFDLASLLVVDHPTGTEVFVDERFAVPPPKNGITITDRVQPLASVRDDRGGDVRADVESRDGRYLDFAGRGPYQGVTRDHFVEFEIPESAPRSGPLWLVAHGWIHPTDSSINVALGQGTHAAPRGLTLEVADSSGRFRTARANLGFPAGKNKTILIDMEGLFARTGQRRARLSTNMEIFWDHLGWAVGRSDVTVATRRLLPDAAELRYRGYSRTEQKNQSSPELPSYTLEGTAPRWRDLEGYYTRFGDVRELLLDVDDRYVIMNAGDELKLRFAASPPPAGVVRDFVMVTDGWEKDGDFNTTFSRTVLPLPTHSNARYDRAPRTLEDDPVYQRHPGDFATFHTRYVGPGAVRDALRGERDPNE
jgi:tetratricopeptide (TPR) repeat protein